MSFQNDKQELIEWIDSWKTIPSFFKALNKNKEFRDIFLEIAPVTVQDLSKEKQAEFVNYIIGLLDYSNDKLIENMDGLLDDNDSNLTNERWLEVKPNLLNILKIPIKSLDSISKKLQVTLSHNNLLKTLITASKDTKLIIYQQLINKMINGVDAVSVVKINGKFIDVNNNEISEKDAVEYFANALLYSTYDSTTLLKKYPDRDFSKRLKLEHANIEYKNITVDNFNIHKILTSFINVSEHPNSNEPPYSLFVIDFTLKHDTLNSITIETNEEETLTTINNLLNIKRKIFNTLYDFSAKYIKLSKGKQRDITLIKRTWNGFSLLELLNNGKFLVLRGNLPIFKDENNPTQISNILTKIYTINKDNVRYILIDKFLDTNNLLNKAYKNIKNDFDDIYSSEMSEDIKKKMNEDFGEFTSQYRNLIKSYFDVLSKDAQFVSKEEFDIITNFNIPYTRKKDDLLKSKDYKKYFRLKKEILEQELGYNKTNSESVLQNDNKKVDKLVPTNIKIKK